MTNPSYKNAPLLGIDVVIISKKPQAINWIICYISIFILKYR